MLKSITSEEERRFNPVLVWNKFSIRVAANNSLLKSDVKTIIDSISGYLNYGSINALMGPSGCGKSTLLNIFIGKHNGYISESNIYVTDDSIRTCFIAQDVSDHLLLGLRVRESLIFASRLKNTGETNSSIDHRKRVNSLLKDFMLTNTADNYVMNCSGGEQKRLAIAAELTAINAPNIICIDESTSGLDSNAAETVIFCLKNIAIKNQIAIITSIHQPNSDILRAFESVYVLSKVGKCIYFGKPDAIGEHLSKAGIIVENYEIPIEMIIKHGSKLSNDIYLTNLIHETEQQSHEYIREIRKEFSLIEWHYERQNKQFYLKSLWILIIRSIKNNAKLNKQQTVAQILVSCAAGVILSTLGNTSIGKIDGCISEANSSNNTTYTPSQAMMCLSDAEIVREHALLDQNIIFLFMTSAVLQFIQIVTSTMILSNEIRIFFNEQLNGWYSTGSYYWAKVVTELPILLLIAGLYVPIIYFISNQINTNYQLFGVVLLVLGALIGCQSLGFLYSILFDNSMQLAVSSAIGVWLVFIFFSDFFIPLQEMTDTLKLISNLSFVKLSYLTSVMLVYGLNRCPDSSVSWVLKQFNLHTDTDSTIIIYSGLLVVILLTLTLFPLMVLNRKTKF